MADATICINSQWIRQTMKNCKPRGFRVRTWSVENHVTAADGLKIAEMVTSWRERNKPEQRRTDGIFPDFISIYLSIYCRWLQANPCQHPIVILRDVKHRDMEALLRFMYNGEVSVSNEQLPSVLHTARMLQVKGLADVPSKHYTKRVNQITILKSSPTGGTFVN